MDTWGKDFSDKGLLKNLLKHYQTKIYDNETKFIKRFFPGFQDENITHIGFTDYKISVKFYKNTLNSSTFLCDFDAVTQWVDNLK